MSIAYSWRQPNLSHINEKFKVKGSEEPSALMITSGNSMELEKDRKTNFSVNAVSLKWMSMKQKYQIETWSFALSLLSYFSSPSTLKFSQCRYVVLIFKGQRKEFQHAHCMFKYLLTSVKGKKWMTSVYVF